MSQPQRPAVDVLRNFQVTFQRLIFAVVPVLFGFLRHARAVADHALDQVVGHLQAVRGPDLAA